MRAIGRPILSLMMLAGLMAGVPAYADDTPKSCDVPAYLLTSDSPLPKVSEAIKAGGPLNILVIGSRSSTIVGAEGDAYPARLQAALREKLPNVTVNVSVELHPRRTAQDMVPGLGPLAEAKQPTLVVWQTGTVDAIRSVDPDDFRAAVIDGVAALQKTGADVVLMNMQYSPRTETMTSPSSYIDNMRVAAQQQNVPVFDRFAIMHQWNESGDFDLFKAVHGVELAKRVHDCLGRALSTFVIDTAHINPAEAGTQRP
ncbi:MAG TPA: SGNH/GDSL hydrolase family protein [Nitrobacter sp.]|nr:SGNH/GDSL hydrolase family protein [Nitrobacter sp.]